MNAATEPEAGAGRRRDVAASGGTSGTPSLARQMKRASFRESGSTTLPDVAATVGRSIWKKASTPLDAPLAKADRIIQQERGATALLRSWPWVFGFVIAAFVADVILHLGPLARVAWVIGGGLMTAALGARAAWLAWLRRNPPEYTARILESRDPALGSKLINLLQLQAQTSDERLAPITRELAGMAIESYAVEVRELDLPRLARTDRVRHDAKRAGYGLLGFIALLGLGYEITRVEAPRFLDPFGDHPPFSFTRIEIADPGDDQTQIVYGGNLLVTAKTRGHRPRDLFLTYHAPGRPEEAVTVAMFDKGERGFTQQIEGITSDLVIVAHTKNRHSLSRQRFADVILTPKLDSASVKITAPAYTGMPPEEKPLQFKSLKALAGSTIEFRLTSNRPLQSGQVEVIRSANDIEAVQLVSAGENQVTGRITAAESARLRFSIMDRDGHPSVENWELALTVTHDLGPGVQLTNPNGDSFVAMDFKIDVVAEANDDYGIKTLRIHQARNGEYGEPHITDLESVGRHARAGYTLDIAAMELASGDTISLFAESIDTAPEPHVARSKTVTLTVITVDEYNAFLRQQTDISDVQNKYSELITKLHDMIEEQKKLGAQSEAQQEALEKAADDSAREAAQRQLDQLLAKQNELNQKLNKLAETMDNFVRDDPLYDIEAELQETLRKKAEQIRESTAQNDQSSQQLAQQSTPEEGARQVNEEMFEEFKRASDRQAAKLGAVEREAREQLLAPLQDMSLMQEIMKDLNRIQALYEAQRELASQARAYNKPGPLAREDQLALKDLAAQQNAIGAALQEVAEKLWEDSRAAREKFPKAADSAEQIHDKLVDMRLPALASQGTEAMLAGRGEQGSQIADRIRDQLESLFGECKSQGGGMSNELDQYLSLTRGMNPASNFEQMMQCRKFGSGREPGSGFGMGMGGEMGSSGYAVIMGQNPRVLGNETSISSSSSQPGERGQSNQAAVADKPEVTVEKSDTVGDVNPQSRESGAVQGETTIEQYSDLVDRYFKAITK